MTSKELNKKLINYFPEIKDLFYEETSWQDGIATGSHVTYADVFVPFIKAQIKNNNEIMFKRVFDYIESLLDLDDEYVNEVIAQSVIESLVYNNEIEFSLFLPYMREKTLKQEEEIIKNID